MSEREVQRVRERIVGRERGMKGEKRVTEGQMSPQGQADSQGNNNPNKVGVLL